MRWLALLLLPTIAACGSDSDPAPEGEDTGGTTLASSSDDTSTDTTGTSAGTGPDPDGSDDSDTLPTSGAFPPPEPGECIDDVSSGDHTYECGGLSFDVTIPPNCISQACAVIVDVHGFTMSAPMQEANTHLRERGSARDYIVIQPSANPAPPASSWNPGVDDEAVIDFLMRMVEAFHADESRLHFTGFSQGGYMSWRMLCEHADLFASVAPAAACGGDAVTDCDFVSTQPTTPVDILFVHGLQDVLVPYDCVEPRRDAVVAAYGLDQEELVEEGEGYTWTRHSNADGTDFELIVHDWSAENTLVLGGHCYPGSDDPGTAPGQLMSYACIDPGLVHWGDAVLDFFDAHPGG